jgi:hypothetical protein
VISELSEDDSEIPTLTFEASDTISKDHFNNTLKYDIYIGPENGSHN